MKIDIITLHAVKNYGSVLQTLATQEIFTRHGYDVTIINYIRNSTKYLNLLKLWADGNPIKAIAIAPTLLRWKFVFDDFCKENLNLSKDKYTSLEDFNKFPLNADVYCTGSDQVWNSEWNKGIELPLYLSFVPEGKVKIAFASSFGHSILTDKEIKATKKYIEQYTFISVREDSAKRIIENQYGYNKAYNIVDPTLALPAEFWRRYSSPQKVKGEYMLIYNLNRSKEFDDYAKKLSKATGLKMVRLCTRFDQMIRPGESILVPSVPDFISLIDNAKLVLTDSFHATAFSLNMNKEPVCVYPEKFSDRLDSFLKLTHSTQRHIKGYSDFDVINRPVDFTEVNNILSNERKKVNDFIDMVSEYVENI